MKTFSNKWKRQKIVKQMSQEQTYIAYIEFIKNLKNYSYDGFKLKLIPSNKGDKISAFSIEIGTLIKFREITEDSLVKIGESVKNIRYMLEKARRNFIRYFENGTKDHLSSKAILGYFQNNPPFYLRTDMLFAASMKMGIVDLDKVPWENVKKILDKFFFINQAVADTILKDPNVRSTNMVDGHEMKEPILKIAEPIQEATEEHMLAMKELQELQRRANKYIYTQDGIKYKTDRSTILKHSAGFLMLLISAKCDAEANTKHEHAINSPIYKELEETMKKASVNAERFASAHGFFATSRYDLYSYPGISKDFHYLGGLDLTLTQEVLKEKSMEECWESLKKILNKFFFIYAIMKEQIDERMKEFLLSPMKLTLHGNFPLSMNESIEADKKPNKEGFLYLLKSSSQSVEYIGYGQTMYTIYPGITRITLSEIKDGFYMDIEVHPDYQGKGFATGAMNALTMNADQYNIRLTGVVKPYGNEAMNAEQLKKFYAKYGFKYKTLPDGTYHAERKPMQPMQEAVKLPTAPSPYKKITDQIIEKLKNYSYPYNGKEYKLKYQMAIGSDYIRQNKFMIYIRTQYNNDIEEYPDHISKKFDEETNKANINFKRFTEYLGIEGVQEYTFGTSSPRQAFQISFRYDDPEDPIHALLTAKITEDTIRGTTVEKWWKSFEKVVNKFFFTYFAVLERINIILAEYGMPLMEIDPYLEK